MKEQLVHFTAIYILSLQEEGLFGHSPQLNARKLV